MSTHRNEKDFQRWLAFCAGHTPTELAAAADARRALGRKPAPWDIGLVWSPTQRAFIRAGVVIDVAHCMPWPSRAVYYMCHTLEQAPADPSRGVRWMRRRFTPARGDRFVRWRAMADAVIVHRTSQVPLEEAA